MDPTCATSPTATGTAVRQEARTPPTAPPPTWGSAVPPTACLPPAKRQEEPPAAQKCLTRTGFPRQDGPPVHTHCGGQPANHQRSRLASQTKLLTCPAHAPPRVLGFGRTLPCFTLGSFTEEGWREPGVRPWGARLAQALSSGSGPRVPGDRRGGMLAGPWGFPGSPADPRGAVCSMREP